MAQALLRRDQQAAGLIPLRCAKTGVFTTDQLATSALYTPRWTWLLFLFGFLPGFLTRVFAARRTRVTIAMTAAAWAAHQRQRRQAVAVVLVGLTVFVVGIIPGSAVAMSAGGVIVIAGLLLALVTRLAFPSVLTPTEDGDIVVVRCHPAFAEEAGVLYQSWFSSLR